MHHLTRHVYENGLTLILVESHQAPVVSLNICLRAGSQYETDQEAGLCHLIEHMLFKGTPTLGPGEVAKRIEARGGEINAYTSFDETVYYCTLASRFFEEGLEILTDAVLRSVFDPDELAREKEVVIEEILRSKDSPGKVLSEAIFEKTFPHHNYGRPIIGSKETVNSFSRDKIIDFWSTWYVPENMVVVASGDFQTAHALKLCEKIFGSLQKRSSPPRPSYSFSPQTKNEGIVLSNPIQGSTMSIAYRVPQLNHEDIPALDVLSHVLGEGDSSRMEINIKERRGLVNSIYSYVYSPKDPGLFSIGYTLPENKIPQATQAVFKEIYSMLDKPIDHDELARAKINIKSDAIYEKETVEGLARKYGYFETILGQHDFDEQYYHRIDSITRDDVQEVIERYLQPQNLTIGLIYPQDSKKKWNPKELLQWTTPPKAKKLRAKKSDEVQHFRLKNGLKLILKENHHVPTFVIRTAHLGGLRAETPASNGVHSLLAQLWGKSTTTLNAEEMAREVELLAGSIDAYNGKNITGMKGDFLSEKLKDGIDLFLDAFLNPRFDRSELAREKSNILEAIKREEDQLAGLAFKQFQKKLYPKHPYGMPLLGTTSTIRALNRNNVTKVFRQVMNPKNTVISLVGDFDSKEMLEKLKPALETLRPRPHAEKKLKIDPFPKKIERLETRKEKFQSHIVLGFPGVHFHDPDRYALDVFNNIMAGQGGRLFIELRDKLSLAYSVTSMSQEGIEPGYFGVYIATEPRKVDTAIEGILKELQKVIESPVTSEELDRAKQYLVGTYEIELQRSSTVATQLACNELFGLARSEWIDLPKKILKVTERDVLRVARKIIKLDRYILSIVRP